MTLESGTTLGWYTIRAPLGAGGMGEVYRAWDRKLDRDVALKVLPPELATSPERRRRFEREARLVAALNHPNIAAIHGLEEADGVQFLELELVEGETLHQRLLRGRVPVEEALRLAQQIARALEAAHEKGVVHRDLKPGNLMVTPDGVIKVLDFGLAKLARDDTAGPEERTATADAAAPPMTRPGTIVGTSAYMSPEQARGEEVDARTDVFAFGAVLYEMVTGRRAFEGGSNAEILAAVLKEQPKPPSELVPEVPKELERIVLRCLRKERRDRLQAIGDARVLIQDCLSSPGAPLRLPNQRRTRWRTRAAALVLVGAGLAWLALRAAVPPPPPHLIRPVQISAAIGVEDYPSWSPDGRTLAYESDETGRWDIWVAQVGGGAAADRTADDPADHLFPSWSPDGSQIAFLSDREEGSGYYVVPALGGRPRRVITLPRRLAGGSFRGFYRGPPSWSADGRELAGVVYAMHGDNVEAFIEVTDVVTLEARRIALPSGAYSRRDLDWSPDGRFFAFTACPSGEPETSELWVLRASDGQGRALTDGRTWVKSPRWGPDARYLDYVSNRDGTSDLWRQQMDARGQPVGDPVAITSALQVRQARFSPDRSRLALSRGRWVSNVWRVPLLDERPATWQDAEQVTFDEAFIEFIDVSPDGGRLAFSSDRAGNQDLWTIPVGGGDLVRLTADPVPEWCPRWSPDGSRMAFYSLRSGTRQIWVMPAEGGAATRVTRDDGNDAVPTWSPDGRELAYWSERAGSPDLWIRPLDGGRDRQVTNDAADDYVTSWSPDGRWLAFTSDRNGENRIWRVPAAGGEPEGLSRRAGAATDWSPDGRRLYFVSLGTGAEEAGDLWVLSLEDRTERPATQLRGRRGRMGGQAVATDGRFLYFTWRTDRSDVWVMDVASH